MRYDNIACTLAVLFLVFTWAGTAFAHQEAAGTAGILSGLKHPVSGWDHVLAMLAVGLWGAQLRAPAIWVLPVAFPMVMALGGLLGLLGYALPGVETGIALSALVLGLMVFLERRPPLWQAILLVGIFAVFHGHAHGTELPKEANGIYYSLGFVMSTGLLHALGIALGLLYDRPLGRTLVRTAGGGIALSGIFFLRTALG